MIKLCDLIFLTAIDKHQHFSKVSLFSLADQPNLFFRVCILLIALTSLASCDLISEDSDDIASEDLFLLAEFTAKGNSSTYIKVNLHKEDMLGQPVELVNGDKLTVTYLGESVVLNKDDNIVEIDYTASIANQGQGGTYTLIFDRHDGSQITSTVIMPEPYNINSPSENTVFSQGDKVAVTWSPLVLNKLIKVHGHLRCKTYEDDLSTEWDNENETWDTADSGEYSLPINKLISNLTFEITLENEHFDYTVPCELDFDMSRTNEANLVGQYVNGSSLTAVQYRQVKKLSLWLLE